MSELVDGWSSVEKLRVVEAKCFDVCLGEQRLGWVINSGYGPGHDPLHAWTAIAITPSNDRDFLLGNYPDTQQAIIALLENEADNYE